MKNELHLSRLFKEYEFYKSDYDYKIEMVKKINISFFEDVERILGSNSELKSLYKSKSDVDINDYIIIEQNIDKEEIEEREIFSDIPIKVNVNKLKELYREIAKVSHPDKVSNKGLNNFYIEASRYYRNFDIIGLYIVCEKLAIPYEVNDEEIQELVESVSDIKEKIKFIQTTYPWAWFSEENKKNKNQIILKYIKSQII